MPFVTAESTARARQLCQQLATHRTMLGLTQRDIAAHFNDRQGNVQSIEAAAKHPRLSTLVAYAWALGLEVGLVAEYHLPLLNLTADETAALLRAAGWWADAAAAEALRDGEDDDTDPALRSALDKLTTTKEPTDA